MTSSSKRGVSAWLMTCAAPSSRAFASFSSDPAVAMTVQPSSFAIWIAALPMPEPAARTRTHSSALVWARVTSMCQAVPNADGRAAASVSVSPSGVRTRHEAGATTYSAKPPSRLRPMISRFSHRFSRPSRQNAQVPSAVKARTMTRSPTDHSVTAVPTAAIVPAGSNPPMWGRGARIPLLPSRTWRSRWFKPHAPTRTRTSSGPGTGSATSSYERTSGPPRRRKMTAFIGLAP